MALDLLDLSNKRTCLRSSEKLVHDDTPAVRGIRSRLGALAEQRKEWLTGGKFS